MTRIRRSLVVFALTTVLCSGTVVAEGAHKTQRICQGSMLRGSGGSTHGSVHRGDKVIVTRRDKRRRRSYVIARNGQGWIPNGSLCKR